MNNEFPNWFASTEAENNFNKYLTHQAGKPNLTYLQLGVYTGDASVWLMNNILTESSSKLYDIDTWQGSDEEAHEKINFEKVLNFYRDRTKEFNPRLRWYKGKTIDFLRSAWVEQDRYDFVYIDADHTAVGVLLDAELSWDLVKSGGIVAFDDYQWDQGKGELYNPRAGIDTFIQRHRSELEIIHLGWQIWVSKK